MQDHLSKSYPKLVCWQVEPGSRFVFGRCPLCSRIHVHGNPAGNRPRRVPHCGRADLPEYTLVVQPGPAPAWLKAAAALPLGDVELALRGLTTEMQGVWREPSGREIEIPDASQVQEALRALRSCSYKRQADEIAAHLKAALSVNKRSARSYWATEAGNATRLRIVATLRECLVSLGGLAPAEKAVA
jgi:hypothetical protein